MRNNDIADTREKLLHYAENWTRLAASRWRGSRIGAKSQTDHARALPEIEPYSTWFLETDDGHRLYVEECGNPDGKPVIFLHGGPGGGTNLAWRLSSRERYRIVLF
ncbi:MAG: hypothetical protein R2855_10675 [Thermomicrobiales bacterium]